MSIQIQKAQRQRAKLRAGLSGPSGAGKTYSALLLAAGLTGNWEKVCLIDTENGSGSLYSDLGAYNVITLTAPFSPERYVEAITAAQDAGMEVIVIDSVSHEWDGRGGSLEINETLAQAKYRGNTWAAWSETTPRHQKFIDAIVQSPAHIITTVRNKVETMQTDDKKVKKVGTKEIQREGFEYELTVNFNVDRENHLIVASKDRTGLFIHRDPFVITQQVGEELRTWNESGAEAPIDIQREKSKVMFNLKRLGFEQTIAMASDKGAKAIEIVMVLTEFDITDQKRLPDAVRKLESWTDVEGAQATYGMAVQDRRRAEQPVMVEESPQEEEIRPEDIPF